MLRNFLFESLDPQSEEYLVRLEELGPVVLELLENIVFLVLGLDCWIFPILEIALCGITLLKLLNDRQLRYLDQVVDQEDYQDAGDDGVPSNTDEEEGIL